MLNFLKGDAFNYYVDTAAMTTYFNFYQTKLKN